MEGEATPLSLHLTTLQGERHGLALGVHVLRKVRLHPLLESTDRDVGMNLDSYTKIILMLEALDESAMTEVERIQHHQAIKDAYWRRRMASRTPEEIAKGVVAP